MWKTLVIVAILIHHGKAQRPFYASRPGSHSKVLPRFRKTESTTPASEENVLAVRSGVDEDENSSSSSELLPEGTLEDPKFVQRVATWPEGKHPFWFINRKVISSEREKNSYGGNMNQGLPDGNQRPVSKFQTSFFAPSKSRPRNFMRNEEQN